MLTTVYRLRKKIEFGKDASSFPYSRMYCGTWKLYSSHVYAHDRALDCLLFFCMILYMRFSRKCQVVFHRSFARRPAACRLREIWRKFAFSWEICLSIEHGLFVNDGLNLFLLLYIYVCLYIYRFPESQTTCMVTHPIKCNFICRTWRVFATIRFFWHGFFRAITDLIYVSRVCLLGLTHA